MRKYYPMMLLVVVMAVIWGCGEKLTEEQLRAKALDFENKELAMVNEKEYKKFKIQLQEKIGFKILDVIKPVNSLI